MTNNWGSTKIIGSGVTKEPLSNLLKSIRILFYISLYLFLFLLPQRVFGFHWIFSGLSVLQSILISVWITLVVFILRKYHSKIDLILFNIKKESNQLQFYGFRNQIEKIRAYLLTGLTFLTVVYIPFQAADELSIPKKIEIQRFSQNTIRNESSMPVFFWDYSTFIPIDWLKDRDIIIPYEKGLPQKLLSKIYFRNNKTHMMELELHGKRPRNFSYVELQGLFDRVSKNSVEKYKPKAMSLFYWIRFEAGLTHTDARELFHLYYDNGTHLFGIPWTEKNGGRFFFLGPDGAIFQVRCHNPCQATDLLAYVKFPDDPKGSYRQRQEFVSEQIKKFLKKLTESAKTDIEQRATYETILRIYLASYITLNPAASEAFFHLGKLTKSRDALGNIIRYAKDLKMDPAALAELELQYNSLTN